jgi:hypothetical protein
LVTFENIRGAARRSTGQLVLSKDTREAMLVEWGVKKDDIVRAIRASNKAKHQRRRTVNNIASYDKYEAAVEDMGAKVKKALLHPQDQQVEKKPLPVTSPKHGEGSHDDGDSDLSDNSIEETVPYDRPTGPRSVTSANDDDSDENYDEDDVDVELNSFFHMNFIDEDSDSSPQVSPVVRRASLGFLGSNDSPSKNHVPGLLSLRDAPRN